MLAESVLRVEKIEKHCISDLKRTLILFF